MSWTHNAPIRIQLGTVALWNLFFKRKTINGNDPTLQLLKTASPRQFDDLTSAPMPATMEARRA